jgi:hypothetical protein
LSRPGSAMCSATSHLTARRRRSGVQSRPRCFSTRAMSSQVWSGRIRRTVGSHWLHRRLDACAIGRFLRGRHLGQRLRPALADAGIARQLAFRLRGLDSGLGAFGDQRALELRHGAEHLQREHALRRRRVDRIPQRPEMRAFGGQILDHLEQMADRARQAVEPHHDQRVAGADLAQRAWRGQGGRARRRSRAPGRLYRSRPRAAPFPALRVACSSVETRA